MSLKHHIFEQVVNIDVFFSDGSDVFMAILAPLFAFPIVSIIIGLEQEPVLIIEVPDIVDPFFSLREHNSLVVF